jgi:hypothetical protein
VCRDRVGHGVQLCAREVEAVHGHKGGDWGMGGMLGGVARVEGGGEALGKSGFAWSMGV